MVGITVTGNMQTDWFPEASVAVQVRIVVPRGKKLPEGGTQITEGAGLSRSGVSGPPVDRPSWSTLAR